MTGAPFITINGRRIGKGHPVYVIAEISANHNQNFEEAVRLIEAAKEAGVDAVKLQTYTADTLTIRSDKECFRISGGTLWDGKTLYDLYGEAYTPWEWQPKLKEVANRLGMDLFSTAFDPTAVDFLESLDVPVHKVASFENVDIPLIRKMAGTGRPLIISTGMATLPEIEEAVSSARAAGAREIALLKCTSAYPAPPDETHLSTIPHLEDVFHVPVGLSDHTLGVAVPIAAVALGASIVEKHFTLSRSIPGPDSVFSLEPHELKEMVSAIRTVEKAVGSVHYGLSTQETASASFRRSLFVVNNVKAGEVFTPGNVRSIRPACGIHPRYLTEVLGRHAVCNIERGTPVSWDLVGPPQSGGIRGERVYLRPMCDQDTDVVVGWRNDPFISGQSFSERPPTRQEHESFLAELQRRSDRQEFIIALQMDDRPIGQIGLSRIDPEHGRAEYGILIGDHEFRGHNMAYEASRQLFDHAFRTLGLRCVTLHLFSDNVPARRLYERLGFVEDPVAAGERLKDGSTRPTMSMYLDRCVWEERESTCHSSA